MHRHFAKPIRVEKRLCCCRVVIDFVSKTQKNDIITSNPACHKRTKYSQRLKSFSMLSFKGAYAMRNMLVIAEGEQFLLNDTPMNQLPQKMNDTPMNQLPQNMTDILPTPDSYYMHCRKKFLRIMTCCHPSCMSSLKVTLQALCTSAWSKIYPTLSAAYRRSGAAKDTV